jgi:PBP1b-binding outer membrane lipoprotein LpoB
MKKKKLLTLTLVGTLILNSCSTTTTKEKIIYIDNIPPKEDTYKPKEKSIYEKEVQEKIISLLKAPETPLRTPDIITRVLILPYTKEDGTLVMSHYVFVKMKEGKWILGDYLIDQPKEENNKIIRPLREIEIPDAKNQTPKSKNISQLPPNLQSTCLSGKCKNINEAEAENLKQQINQMKESLSNMQPIQPTQPNQQQVEIQNQENIENME